MTLLMYSQKPEKTTVPEAGATPGKNPPSYVEKNINYNSSKKKHANVIGDRQVPDGKTGGRPKGSKNFVKGNVREILANFVEHNAAGAQVLYDRVAKTSPAKALDILVKVAEFVIPKLNRTEVTMEGSPLVTPNPISDANEAAATYAAILGNSSLDLTVITYNPPAQAPLPDVSVVAVQEQTSPTPPAPDNVVQMWEHLSK